MKNKLPFTNTLLVLLILLENACLYYFFKLEWLTQGKNAWLYFLSSLFFGIVLIYKFYNASIVDNKPNVKQGKVNIASYIILPLVLIGGLVWLGFLYEDLFLQIKLETGYSDIIPNIQLLCRRLLTGKYPYARIDLNGYSMDVTYLPMHWLPFTIAEWLKIDYRWIVSSVWGIASILLLVRTLRVANLYIRTFIPLLLLASNFVLFYNNNSIIAVTIELMIAAYYMLFITGLNQKSAFVQGLFISFCILSRYSLILWLPLYAFVLYVSGYKKSLLYTVLTVVVIVLVAYVIPFLSKDPSILLKSYKEYDSGTFFEWNRMQTKGINKDKPLMLFSGTGFAYYFYTRFTELEVMMRMKLLQKVHLFCSLGVTVILGIWFWFKREKINVRIFLMGSFKIYLSVFLFLIQIPYEYLMTVGNFVTIAIFCEQARYSIKYKDQLV